MEGRYPPAIMLTLAHCADPQHTEQWLDWYARIHTPDVTSAGVFTHMIRFMNTAHDHGGCQIANLSETEFADPLEAIEALKERRAPFTGEDRRSPYTRVVEGGGPMVRVGGQFQYVKNAPVRSIFLEGMSLTNPAAERAFNRWYNDDHIPSLLSGGGFQSAYRYQGFSPQGPTMEFVCIYESDRRDVEQALTESIAVAQGGQRAIFADAKPTWEMTAIRIWPMEGRES